MRYLLRVSSSETYKRTTSSIPWLALFLIQLLVFCIFPACSAAAPAKNILTLHSYHKGLSWTDNLVRGIDDGFENSGLNYSITHEFMDTKRIFSSDYLKQLKEIYQLKYSKVEFDVIISTDDHAFNFLLDHHQELFGNTPVVFCGVNNFNQKMLQEHENFTGILENIDMGSTLEIVQKLHPDAKRFIAISDQTLTGKANRLLFEEAVSKHSQQVELVFLDNHTMDEVRQQVSTLAKEDVTFWLTFTWDRNGNYYSFRESAALIAENNTAPLYSFWDFHLGYGITGGRLASSYYQGQKAVEVALDVVKGTPASEIRVITESPNRFMFDHNQLTRFNLDQSRLPQDSIFINQPKNFYSDYTLLAWSIIAGFLALCTIIILLVINVHNRFKANKAITRAKNRMQRLFDNATVGLFEVDFKSFYDQLEAFKKTLPQPADKKDKKYTEAVQNALTHIQILDCNQAAVDLYQAETKDELLDFLHNNKQLFTAIKEENILKPLAEHDKAHRIQWELSNTTIQGNNITVLVTMQSTGRPFSHASNPILSVVDISQPRKYIDALRLSESRFRALFNTAASGIALVSLEGNYLRVNDAFCAMLGYKRDELRHKSWQTVTHPSDLDKCNQAVAELLQGKSLQPYEKRFLHKDGRSIWVLLQMGLNSDKQGKPINFVAQIQDITELRKAQQKISLKEQRYRQLFDADLTGFYISNPSGKVLLCNLAFAELLGFSNTSDVVGRNITPYYRSSDTWNRLLENLIDSKKVVNREMELIRSDGKIVNVLANAIGRFSDNGKLLEVQGHLLDISRQKKLENKLVRAQKMEAIGLMAGGVAHDLNNILSGIISYPELILRKLSEEHELRAPLTTVKEAGERAAAVVADLLTVARSAANVREVHNLSELTAEYLKSPECKKLSSIYPHITITLKKETDSSFILCSPVHIKKSIMNLVTNSMEAIENEGEITISIMPYTPQHDSLEELRGENYVLLQVRDNGPGIDQNDLEHIFEPFYTKKIMGRSGTGLGLAVVWNTVQDHDGKIVVESDESGTTFKLFFPHYDQTAVENEQKIDTTNIMGNGERILVVDDEPVLRNIAYQILSTLGYSVDTVSSGENAILYLKSNTVDLVLLDMFMEPGINGRQTYERIIRIHPGQKAIIASGFSKSDDIFEAMRMGVGGFIEKPYSIDQLGHAVYKALHNE